jgi:hypothetical protein
MAMDNTNISVSQDADQSISAEANLKAPGKKFAQTVNEILKKRVSRTQIPKAISHEIGMKGIKSKYSSLKRRLKIADTIAATIAVAGIIIAYVENEDFYDEETEKENGETKTTKDRNESTDAGNALRGLNMFLTAILLIMLVVRYVNKLKILKVKR